MIEANEIDVPAPAKQPEKTAIPPSEKTTASGASKATALSCLEKEIEAMREGNKHDPCKWFSQCNELVRLNARACVDKLRLPLRSNNCPPAAKYPCNHF